MWVSSGESQSRNKKLQHRSRNNFQNLIEKFDDKNMMSIMSMMSMMSMMRVCQQENIWEAKFSTVAAKNTNKAWGGK